MKAGARTAAAVAVAGGVGALLAWLGGARPWAPEQPEEATALAASPRSGRRGDSGPGATGAIVLALAVAALAGTAGWEAMAVRQRHAHDAAMRMGGDPARGRAPMVRYGCAGCHAIAGLGVPQGRAGPPLDGVTSRTFIAGRLRNTPDNLVRWIVDPKSVDPQTAMPVTGISPQEARDVAAALAERE